jgi:signal transduction histidine kinase
MMMIDLLDRLRGFRNRWRRLPLASQFLLGGGTLMLVAMLLCGILTTTFMTNNLVQRRGSAIALISQHIFALSVAASQDQSPSIEDFNGLDALFARREFTAQFPHLDVWLPDGTIVYSNTPAIRLRNFPLPQPVIRAFAGETISEFSDVDTVDYREHGFDTDFIEVYFPLRNEQTGEIVAVAELRESTTALESALWSLTLASWATVGIISTIVMASLFSIVLEGSRTIDRHRRIQSKRLKQSHARAAQHRQLTEQAQRASKAVTELTDRYLRTVGTDLHDGPAQSIGFAVLKLEQVRKTPKAGDRNQAIDEIESALGGALQEIRAIATNLVLPDIGDLNLAEVINRAVQIHIQRTGIAIAVDSRVAGVHVDQQISVCVFRFIQEGLNNAFHHGLPEGQQVIASLQKGVLKLSIVNLYTMGERSTHADHLGIGLYGLRARVQSIGGNFVFVQNNGVTRLEMWLTSV